MVDGVRASRELKRKEWGYFLPCPLGSRGTAGGARHYGAAQGPDAWGPVAGGNRDPPGGIRLEYGVVAPCSPKAGTIKRKREPRVQPETGLSTLVEDGRITFLWVLRNYVSFK